MDFVYQLATAEAKAKSSDSIPLWKIELSKLPALTTRHAAYALADVDFYKFTFNPEPSEEEVEASTAEEQNITRWLRVIENAAGSHELPAENIRNGDHGECDIWMFSHANFASWCQSKGILCPIPINASVATSTIELHAANERILELEKLLSVAKNSTQFEKITLGGWPWGSHETDLLRKLAGAANKWWIRYDPADATTAPTNDQVTNWLKNEGVSNRVAEVMASILRIDGLPSGPRK